LGDDAHKLDIVVTKPDIGGETGVRGLSTPGNEGNVAFLTTFGAKRGAPLNPRRSARPMLLKSALASRPFSSSATVALPKILALGAVIPAIKMSEVIIEESEAAEGSE
jgi:hypothetical protein